MQTDIGGVLVPLPWPTIAITGRPAAAEPLLRAFTAVVHGYAHVPRGGFTDQKSSAPSSVLVPPPHLRKD